MKRSKTLAIFGLASAMLLSACSAKQEEELGKIEIIPGNLSEAKPEDVGPQTPAKQIKLETAIKDKDIQIFHGVNINDKGDAFPGGSVGDKPKYLGFTAEIGEAAAYTTRDGKTFAINSKTGEKKELHTNKDGYGVERIFGNGIYSLSLKGVPGMYTVLIDKSPQDFTSVDKNVIAHKLNLGEGKLILANQSGAFYLHENAFKFKPYTGNEKVLMSDVKFANAFRGNEVVLHKGNSLIIGNTSNDSWTQAKEIAKDVEFTMKAYYENSLDIVYKTTGGKLKIINIPSGQVYYEGEIPNRDKFIPESLVSVYKINEDKSFVLYVTNNTESFRYKKDDDTIHSIPHVMYEHSFPVYDGIAILNAEGELDYRLYSVYPGGSHTGHDHEHEEGEGDHDH